MESRDSVSRIIGEIADYYLSEEGILYSYSKSPKRTIKNISANIVLVKQITQNRKVPLLIYLCPSPIPDKATREFAREKLSEVYQAMAMVSEGGLAKMIMNILFRFQKPPIPMRMFSNDRDAREWLQQYL